MARKHCWSGVVPTDRLKALLPALAILMSCALAMQASASPNVGRENILLDAHGYNTGKGVVVPLRPVAEWLGAKVDFRNPTVEVHLGGKLVRLKVGARQATVNGERVALSTPAKVYGNLLCVPVRFVAQALGCEVEYIADGERLSVTGYIDHVLVRAPGREIRLLVHQAAPDVVAGILEADRRASAPDRRGFDYLLGVTKLAGDWAKAHQPDWWEEFGFGEHWRTGFYRRTAGRWEKVASSSRVSYAREDLAQMGIPVEVARALGSEIED